MLRSAWPSLVLACLVAGCQGADAYYRHAQPAGGTGGASATGGAGGTGEPAGLLPLDGSTSDDPGTTGTGSETTVSDSGTERRGEKLRPEMVEDGGDLDVGGAGGDAAADVPVCEICKGEVLYWCEGTAANTIRATFQLVNDTPAPIPLRELTIRYWFTAGVGSAPWEFACDNGSLGTPPSAIDVTGFVTHVFKPVSPARPGADMYFEVGFLAGDLLPLQASLFRTRVYRNDYTTIAQTDDYSFNAKFVGPPASWSHITLYRNGMLVSGVEPR